MSGVLIVRDAVEVARYGAFAPDRPEWVDVRGALLGGRSVVVPGGRRGDFALCAPDAAFVGVVGQPERRTLETALALAESAGKPVPVLAVEPATAEAVHGLLGDWTSTPAIMHTRSLSAAGPTGADLGWLEASRPVDPALLAHVPDALRRELLTAARFGPIAYARAEDRAVSFAYAPWLTERWFDLSVDTLEAYRRRGLAVACVEALVARIRATGREPVWGALADNEASLGLAGRLGFAPVAETAIFRRRAAPGPPTTHVTLDNLPAIG